MEIQSKAQVTEYIEAEGITSVLNNSKWQRLFDLLDQSPLMFRYRRTDLNGTTFPEEPGSFTPELAQVWGNFWSMEWLEISAVEEIRKGALLKPEIRDFTPELIAIAHEAGVKFTLINQGITVYGYVRRSENPSFQART